MIKRTWEGILSSDSPERSICKKACLDNYGVDAKDASGNACDDRGWNRCMQLMDWGFFHWHKACKDDHKQECEACWRRQTQGCYYGSFKKCLSGCPQ